MATAKASKIDWNVLLRALGLGLVGAGSLAIGGSFEGVNEALIGDLGLPQFVLIFLAISAATVGATINGVAGLAFFAAGNALLGATILSGIVPHWGESVGLAGLVVGVAIRMLTDD